MSPINILHLMNSFEDASISRIVLRLIKYLGSTEYNWHVGALNPAGKMRAEYSQSGAQVVDFSKQNGSAEIKSYIQERNIQIVHTHTPRTILKVVLAQPANVIHISTKHLLFAPQDRNWGLFHALWDRFSLYLPNQIVAVSGTMYAQILSQPGMQKNRVALVRNAIPVEQFYVPEQREAFRAELGLSADTLLIGYSGRLNQVKRIDLLLLAFSQVLAQFPQAHLILAGEGNLKPQLQTYAVHLGLEQAITWLGFSSEIPRFLAALDVYVQPSLNEGLSLSILEAMAARQPIIATQVGGANEVLLNEENGLLIPAGSASAISHALIELLGSPQKRQALGEAAQQRVRKEFNIQAMATAYGSTYQKWVS